MKIISVLEYYEAPKFIKAESWECEEVRSSCAMRSTFNAPSTKRRGKIDLRHDMLTISSALKIRAIYIMRRKPFIFNF